MSKPTQKHKRSRSLIDPHKHHVNPPIQQSGRSPDSTKLLSSKPVIVLIIIAILAAIPFCMGKYFEFNSRGAFDSGAYVYSAKRILDGAKIGIDEKPSAQMGTLLINMLGVKLFGFSDFGPKLIQAILQAAALILMFIVMRKLFGILPAAVGVIIASIYLSAPLMAKYGNVKEQHMIAFMIMGISCFILYQLSNRFWLACLAGAFLSCAPLFKETGVSAAAALGLFVIAQPLLKHRSLKKTGADILLLAAGAVIVVSPICLWLSVQKTPLNYYPYYSLVGRPLGKLIQSPQDPNQLKTAEPNTPVTTVQTTPVKQGLLMKFMPAYVRDSWKILKPEQIKLAKLKVFHYYQLLILPIALALGSIILRLVRIILARLNKSKSPETISNEKFVLLLALWWLMDMAFVWISPRSYVQYYLPLNASGAMLGGYLIAIYHEKLKGSAYKPAWFIIGFVGFILMIIASRQIYKGYSQKRNEIASKPQYTWIMVGQYINKNSTENDKIYVWGWVPGIYVVAQRLSPAPKAFEGTMHTLTPQVLSERVSEILDAFEKEPPKYIVDTRKIHFPWDRPQLELWPIMRKGVLGVEKNQFLPQNEKIITAYDQVWSQMLHNIEPAEALRYKAMKPFREYIMKNYKIVQQPFGDHILFQRK